MTLIKSLLLGSAAGVVAIASAQAADLPTRKGAPAAEYVKVCTINVGGKPVVGFTLPGSDTCIKFSGYVTAQIEGGPAGNSYSTSYVPSAKLNPNIVAGGQRAIGSSDVPDGNHVRTFGKAGKLRPRLRPGRIDPGRRAAAEAR